MNSFKSNDFPLIQMKVSKIKHHEQCNFQAPVIIIKKESKNLDLRKINGIAMAQKKNIKLLSFDMETNGTREK